MFRITKLRAAATGMLLLAQPQHSNAQDLSAAVVRIFAVRPGNSATSLGAGVFISGTGDVLTAYHVVQGASSVEMYAGTTKCVDAQLLAYDEAQDLARLNCRLNGKSPAYAEIGEVPVKLSSKSGEALGFPEGRPLSHVPVNFLQDAPIRGEQYYVAGKQIFAAAAWKVGLLNIDSTLPPGMSGAPVVVDGHVIAVVSGSEELRSRAPGWAMLAVNVKGLKPAEDTRRFDITPKLTMLLGAYADAKSPLLKMALSGAATQRLILAEERLEDLRTRAKAFDTRYAALLERLPQSFEPGRNSFTPGIFGNSMVYGKLAENAIAAADEYLNIDLLDFLLELASVNSDRNSIFNETLTELGDATYSLTPERLQQLIEFRLLRTSASDLDKALTQGPEVAAEAARRPIPELRHELLQLVASAPKDPVDELLKATSEKKSTKNAQIPLPRTGCEACAAKSGELLSTLAASGIRERLFLGELLAAAGLQLRAARILVQVSSDPGALAAKR